MKIRTFTQTALALGMVAFIFSSYSPAPKVSVLSVDSNVANAVDERNYPLIVRPNYNLYQDRDGRHYHKNHDGFTYTKGADGRYYLDQQYLDDVTYSQAEYREWKRVKDVNLSDRKRKINDRRREAERSNRDRSYEDDNDDDNDDDDDDDDDYDKNKKVKKAKKIKQNNGRGSQKDWKKSGRSNNGRGSQRS